MFGEGMFGGALNPWRTGQTQISSHNIVGRSTDAVSRSKRSLGFLQEWITNRLNFYNM